MEKAERRLTALLSADVVGYSRLMGDDDRATLETLSAYRQTFFDFAKRHHGRIVNAPGDAILAEFGSVVYAVDCALEVQRELAARNSELPRARRMDFRIGVSLGDVLVRNDELYGDDVNLAARVESLAPPGGICVTSKVYYEIRNRLGRHCVSIGKRRLKNFPNALRVYRLLQEPAADAGWAEYARFWFDRLQRRSVMGALAFAVVVLLGVGIWKLFPHFGPGLNIGLQTESIPAPSGPSLAVLPLVNLSGDPELDWFSDGITETLITDLANLQGLFVIGRNSVFTYKGKSPDPRAVSRELGVRYVLEGSLQRAGDRQRINVQLIDAQTAQTLWAERFEIALDDIFRVQDEIARHVVTELDAKLLAGDQARIWRRTTTDPRAYAQHLRARAAHNRYTREDLNRAQQLYRNALEIDPHFAIAWVQLGWTYMDQADQGWSEDPDESYTRAIEIARRAIAEDERLGDAHALLGNVLATGGQHEEAVREYELALELNPSSAENLVLIGWGFAQNGRAKEGLALVQRGMRLDPIHPDWYWSALGEAFLFQDRFEEAKSAYERCVVELPDLIWCHAGLVIVGVETKNTELIHRHATELRRIKPGMDAGKNFYVAQIGVARHQARAIRAFKAAGLPQAPPERGTGSSAVDSDAAQ